VKASAPGKIILFGEHAVVYGHPALAVPIPQVRAEVEVSPSGGHGVWIDAADVQLHAELNSLPPEQPLAATIRNLQRRLKLDHLPDLQIVISSTIPVASGLGSGAAVTVALIRALGGALERSISDDQVNELAFETEKLLHGTPSGIDNTVVTYAQPVYFIRGQPIQMLTVAHPIPLVIGDTGVPASTREAVGKVRAQWEQDPAHMEMVFDRIGSVAEQARSAIEADTWEGLGPLMNTNHELLQALGVSSPELDRLVTAARAAGALGAKLSGGGLGGNMVALSAQEEQAAVAAALRAAGAARVIMATVKSA
jgi:mevalonate kinase